MIKENLSHNREFVANKKYEKYITDKYPNKKIAIVACMDTRLIELIPAALGLKNGNMQIVKNAGGLITQPFDSTIRSLLVAIYELGVKYIFIIGHTDCGAQHINGDDMIARMKQHGISEDHIEMMRYCGIDFDSWLNGFDDGAAAISETVDLVRNHPLVPKDIYVYGFLMDSVTGALRMIEDGGERDNYELKIKN